MPTYSGKLYVTSLMPGDIVVVWNAEQPVPGTGGAAASVPVALPPNRIGSPAGFAVDGYFSGAPGAFELDVQAAAVDADAQYQTITGGAITTVDGTNNTFHLDAPTVIAKFVRLLLRSRTNAVNITARISR